MPKLTPLGPNHWAYKCECGKDMEIFSDESEPVLTKVSKCWECLDKQGFAEVPI